MEEQGETRSKHESGPQPVRYVGFDLDGTLIDTMSHHYALFGAFMHERLGIDPEEAGAYYRATAGESTTRQIASLLERCGIGLDGKSLEQLGQEADILLEHAEGEPFAETAETLQKLKEQGWKVFVSSSHPTTAIATILTKHHLEKFVDFFAGTDPDDPAFRKGDTHFRAAAERFGVPYGDFVREAVFIGDGLSDVEAAERSGVRSIGRIGTRKKEELLTHGARAAVNSFEDLPELLAHPAALERKSKES